MWDGTLFIRLCRTGGVTSGNFSCFPSSVCISEMTVEAKCGVKTGLSFSKRFVFIKNVNECCFSFSFLFYGHQTENMRNTQWCKKNKTVLCNLV